MDSDFSPNQKKRIGEHIKKLLRNKKLSQAEIARMHGCSSNAVNTAIWQIHPLHERLGTLKTAIALILEYNNWQELCAEALAQEEINA